MKVLWGVILFNLAAFGLALLSVILHPAEMKAWLTTDIGEQISLVQQKADQQTKQIQKQIDVLAPTATPTPKRTPPPAVDPEKVLKASVEARFEGDYFGEQSITAPPPAGLYPFSVSRRVTDGDMLEVELLMQNASGFQFKNVNIFMRSPDYPRTQLFTLDNWRVDEIALLRYKFPADEKDVRLKNLRVFKVSGEEIGSAFHDSIEIIEDENTEQTLPDGFMLSSLKLVMPDEFATLSEVAEIEIEETTPERTNLINQFDDAYASLYEAQLGLNKFTKTINEDGFEKTMVDGTGLQMIQEIMDSKSQFSSQATRLTLIASRSKDEELKKIPEYLRGFSAILEKQIMVINTQIPLKQYKISDEGLTSSN